MERLSRLPSPVGARLAGDDYQYLLVWWEAVKLLDPSGDVKLVEFEIPEAGNVDDLVAHLTRGPSRYHQIKFAVAPTGTPLDHDWFTTAKTKGGTSPLQKFYDSFQTLDRPSMYLDTNRDAAPDDPILAARRGHDLALGPRLRAEKPDSEAGMVLTEWAEHIGVGREELLQMLEHLHVRTGFPAFDFLHQETCGLQMRTAKLRGDQNAVDLGIAEIRDRVKRGERQLTRDDVVRVADERALWAEDREATLLIQQAAEYPWPEAPTASVDWRPYFEDDEEGERRRLREELSWEDDLRQPLQKAVAELQGTGIHRIRVTGSSRLSGWFIAGFELRHVRQSQVVADAGTQRWASDSSKADVDITICHPIEIGQGEEVAIGLSIPRRVSDAAVKHLQGAQVPVAEFIEILPSGAPDNQLIRSAEEARGIAEAVFQAIERAAANRKIHLFFATPGPLALLLGHRWNRMPPTQLYDDRGPAPPDGIGYEPTFLV